MPELRYYEAERIPYWRWRWWIGLPRPFWISHQAQIGNFIEAHQLRPIDQKGLIWDEAMPAGPSGQQLEAEEALPIQWPRPYPGGLRFAHVHHGVELYALDADQWRAFSDGVLDTVRDRISRAKEVGLVDLVELADAVDGLG